MLFNFFFFNVSFTNHEDKLVILVTGFIRNILLAFVNILNQNSED